MNLEELDFCSIETVERILKNLKKNNPEIEKIPFTYLMASLFPSILNNIKTALTQEFIKGYNYCLESNNKEEVLVTGKTLPEAYHKALKVLNVAPITPCPDWNTNQKEVSMTIFIESPLEEPMISRLSYADPRSLEQYRQEMLDGIMDFEVENGLWEYTYHSRYKDQYQFIIDELKRNPYSRRAVIDIRTEKDIGSKDPACWQHAQYFIRDGKLNCKVLFRSNDACKATYMNAFALIMLQKRIADTLGVEMGSYTHRANSFHCYERDFEMLEKYCERIDKGDNLTYNYVDEWDELMEVEKENITKMVQELKEMR